MGEKVFAAGLVGLGNASSNRQTFGQCVDAYFPGTEGVTGLKLSFGSDWTATVTASSHAGDRVEVMPISPGDLRQLLSGVDREIRQIGVLWTSVDVVIDPTGAAQVKVCW